MASSFDSKTRGNAAFRIQLSKPSCWYYGDEISGDVVIRVNGLFYFRGLVLVLRGNRRCSLIGRALADTEDKLYESESELVSRSISLCGPEAIPNLEGGSVATFESTSYSIPEKSPLLNLTNGKHKFPFSIPTATENDKIHNLPASIAIPFPGSEDRCDVEYVLELHCFTASRCDLVASKKVVFGSLKPMLPELTVPGREYKETLIYPDNAGSVELEISLDHEMYKRGEKARLSLVVVNKLKYPIVAFKASITNHVLVEGSHYDVNQQWTRNPTIKQALFSKSGDEVVEEFKDKVSIDVNGTIKRTYKIAIPTQVWPTYIHNTPTSHPFWIRSYIDIGFVLQDNHHLSGCPSLGVLIGDEERGLRIPLYVVNDQEWEENQASADLSPRSTSTPFTSAPVVEWKPDDDWPNCSLCETPFTMFRRRHHCRYCGSVVCSSCSAMLYIPNLFGSTKQRICHDCNRSLEGP